MTITRIDEAGKVTLKADGWLDTASAPALGEAVDAVESAAEIVLDFEGVEYMASSGLRQVIAAAKKAKEMGAAFRVTGVESGVMNIFAMTGIDKKLDIRAK